MRAISLRAALAACSLCASVALPAAASAAPAAPGDAPTHEHHHTIVQRLERVDRLLDAAARHPAAADRDLDRARAVLRRIDHALDERNGRDRDPRVDAALAALREAEAGVDAHRAEDAREALNRAERLVDAAIAARTPDPTPGVSPAA